MRRLEGRTALVTGGSRGIGRGICLRLAEEGADVAINYATSADAAREVAEAVRALGRRAEVYQADVGVEADCRRMAEQALADFGAIDIFVSNAGIGATAIGRPYVVDCPPEDFERLMSANAFGPFYLCQALVPQMRSLPRGDVVVISSVTAEGMRATSFTYGSSKNALEAMALTLAKEERQHGIHVNIVRPGLIETDMGRATVKFSQGVDLEEIRERQPFGHIGQPEDIANAVVFFCSDDASYVTGQRITVSGN